jgi:uncharacterized protein (DUF952 family)
MEVHPPEHPIHTWRDFFIHIATIVVGLLIAIGLEQTVEYFHHRHLVAEARENIRAEIEENEKQAETNVGYLQTDADLMKANVAKARALRDNPRALEHGEFLSNYSWNSFNESAWTSARDSGALTYMPVEEVQRYDDLYETQRMVNAAASETFTKQLELVAPFIMEDDPSKIKPEDIHQILRESATAYLRLATLHQILEELMKHYSETLKK